MGYGKSGFRRTKVVTSLKRRTIRPVMLNEDKPLRARARTICRVHSPHSFWQYKAYADIRVVAWRGAANDSGVIKNINFHRIRRYLFLFKNSTQYKQYKIEDTIKAVDLRPTKGCEPLTRGRV